MMLTMICYYSFIKLYQYRKIEYDFNYDDDGDNDICPAPIPSFQTGQEAMCYQSVFRLELNEILRIEVAYLMAFLVWMILYWLLKCCSRMVRLDLVLSYITQRCCKGRPGCYLCCVKTINVSVFIVMLFISHYIYFQNFCF